MLVLADFVRSRIEAMIITRTVLPVGEIRLRARPTGILPLNLGGEIELQRRT